MCRLKCDDAEKLKTWRSEGLNNLANQLCFCFWRTATLSETKTLEDREAYNWLKENGIDTSKGDIGELTGYKLPAFDTWSKQLRNARKPLGEQKYTRRTGRATGRSIVSEREI